jgi:hypothetical protein
MKYFMIRYQFKGGSEDEWHREIARFIAALDSHADLKGKISYRCMKRRGGSEYFHIAAAADDQAVKTLQSQDFFSHYTEQTRLAGGGEVEVLPLEVLATTEFRA